MQAMVSSTKKPATYQDLCDLPENQVGELLDGELFASPRPASPHTFAGSALGGELFGPFQKGVGGPGGWWILDEPELHFGRDVLVPDLAGWRRERMPEIRDEPYFTLAPDWLCEIVSPSTARLDRIRKLPKYAAAGVRHAWLLDPLGRTLEVYELQGQRWSLAATHEGDEKVRAAPFDAIGLELGALWLSPG